MSFIKFVDQYGNDVGPKVTLTKEEAIESQLIFEEQMRKEVSYLKKGDLLGYDQCRAEFDKKGVPDKRPSFHESWFGSALIEKVGRGPIRTSDYRYNFTNNKFNRQWDFTEYLSNSFDKLIQNNPFFFRRKGTITKHIPEYPTRYGKCDFIIIGEPTFLLELKIDRALRKDIQQCVDYVKAMKDAYPIALLANRFQDGVKELAEKHGVSLYTYSIKTIAPTSLKITHIYGENYEALDLVGQFKYLLNEWGKYDTS
jgi:hypothetical protein